MKITVLAPDRLTSDHLQLWSQWQRADRSVDNPFFHPEYTRAVAAVRSDAEVAVLEDNGEVVGFFPFQRGRWGAGKPIGGPMTDFQGVIARPGLVWDAEELIRQCGLTAWKFESVMACQQSFRSHHYGTAQSSYLDLSKGFDAYHAERSEGGSSVVKRMRRKAQKMAREVGPLRFEVHSTDVSVLETLIRWKSEQYLRTGVTNIFSYPWTARLLQQVLGQSEKCFAGVLSALYAGSHLVSAHLGMRSHEVMHWWFPSYDPAFGCYSPGLILLIEFSKVAQSFGIHRIDLGKGETSFKLRLKSDCVEVAEGCVAVSPTRSLLRRGWHDTRDWLRSSPLRGAVQLAGKWTRPLRGWLAFH